MGCANGACCGDSPGGDVIMDNMNKRMVNAAVTGNARDVRSALREGADARSKEGGRALGLAAQQGHPECVTLLL